MWLWMIFVIHNVIMNDICHSQCDYERHLSFTMWLWTTFVVCNVISGQQLWKINIIHNYIMLHIHNYTLNDQISFQAIPIKQSWGNSFATKIDRIEFSLNVLVGLVEFSDWRYLSFLSRLNLPPFVLETMMLPQRHQDTAERIFKLNPIYASVIYQIHWILWISISFGENFIKSFTFHSLTNIPTETKN